MRFLSSLAVLAVFTAPTCASASTIDLSTGASPYTITTEIGNVYLGPAKVVQGALPWGATIAGAQWVNLSGAVQNDPAGYYHYISKAFVAKAGANVTGSFASDNQGSVYIVDVTTFMFSQVASNMYGTGPSNYSFNVTTPFTISGLTVGDKYNVTFRVENGNLSEGGTDGAGPMALLAGVTATNVTATPEPSSLALLGTGVLGIVGFARRKFGRA